VATVSELFKEWHWEVTRRCNLNCQHCLTSCGHSVSGGLTTPEALVAIEVMASLGCTNLMITGGEPLVRSDLFALLNSAFNQGMSLGLLTNGFGVDNKLAEQISGYAKIVGISLDGASEHTHDALRGKLSFQAACCAIKLLADRLPVTAYITVSALNIKELRDIIDFVFELGASRIHVSEVTISGRARENADRLRLRPSQRKLLEQLAEEVSGPGQTVDCHCDADLTSVYLSAEGLVYSCSEVGIQNLGQNLGNITEADFRTRFLAAAQSWQVPIGLPCCYQVWAGERIVFCLNSTSDGCALIDRERRQP